MSLKRHAMRRLGVDETMADHGKRGAGRWLWPLWVGITAGLAAIILVLLVPLQANAPASPRHAEQDLAGNNVAPDERDSVTAQRADAVGSIGARFMIPARGLDVPLGAITVVDGQVTPPGYQSAYLLRNEGVPTSRAGTGTVYVVMHSVWGGSAPGNYVIDVAQHRPAVKKGQIIIVGNVRYTITTAYTRPKTALPYDTHVWAPVKNRLVVITCLQRPSGTPSIDNMIIEGTRTP